MCPGRYLRDPTARAMQCFDVHPSVTHETHIAFGSMTEVLNIDVKFPWHAAGPKIYLKMHRKVCMLQKRSAGRSRVMTPPWCTSRPSRKTVSMQHAWTKSAIELLCKTVWRVHSPASIRKCTYIPISDVYTKGHDSLPVMRHELLSTGKPLHSLVIRPLAMLSRTAAEFDSFD